MKRGWRPYVAWVEGEDAGVPWRLFFKNMESAKKVAIETRGVLQDLRTLARQRWIAGEWRQV